MDDVELRQLVPRVLGALVRRDLHEKNGELDLAAGLYAVAARNAPNLAERDHQTRQAARVNQHLQSSRDGTNVVPPKIAGR